MKIRISKETQQNISRTLNADFETVVNIDPADEQKFISRVVVFSRKRNPWKQGRGNPLLARRKIRTLEDVNRKLSFFNLIVFRNSYIESSAK